MTRLTVLSPVESFADFWPAVAADLQLELRVAPSAAELGHPTESLALLLVVAGAEATAEEQLRAALAAGFPAPLVVGTERDHRLAVALLRAGAGNYFALPHDSGDLRAHLADLARRASARSACAQLAESQRTAFDFSRIIGNSPQLRAALDRAARIILRDTATILITGETGTGKELLAQAIHYNGPRAAAPFVELNCAAIPATLLESELFGHERGAFTDARAAKPGLFEAADGGTLFLDEIGHLPYELQGKILRALEEKRVRRVGAVGVRDIDVRIMAATHVDLAEAVRQGTFREDLYYRLSIIPIHLPPLRERGDDVLILAEHFLRTLAEQYQLAVPALTPEFQRLLRTHHWPGNVRELRNSLERALLLSDGSLAAEELFPPGTSPPHSDSPIPFPAPLAEIERTAARTMVQRLEGNKSAAAEALGISRSRLYRLLDGEIVAK